jgi:hypothetical protein
MKGNQELDQIVKERIKTVFTEETKALTMTVSSKDAIISAISRPSLFTGIRNKISVFLEYEIPVPFQLITISVVIAITIGYFLFVPPMRVSADEVQAAKIHVEDSRGGNADENSQN